MASDVVIQENYEILDVIGQGGFGKVYKVRYIPTEALYAYKLISYANETSEVQGLIESEIKLTRHLSHPNIIKFHHVYHSEERKEYHIIMDLCEGGDLRQFIDKRQRMQTSLEEELIWLYMGQILLALAYLHCPFKSGIQQHGRIIHRDIKPANIFIKGSNTLIVGDLGICKDIGRHSSTDAKIGTPAYMAPEVLMNVKQGYNEKSDIWSLGLIVYELCTFERLVSGATVADAIESIEYINFPIIVEGYSLELVEVINGMIDPNIMTRFSAHDLLAHPRLCPYIKRLLGPSVTIATFTYGGDPLLDKHSYSYGLQTEDHRVNATTPCSAKNDPSYSTSLANIALMAPGSIAAKIFNHTPLMIAAEAGDLCGVEAHKAVYSRNTNTRGYTALMLAVEQGHMKCVKSLLGVEAGHQANDGTTALIIALTRGYTDIAKLLFPLEAAIKAYDGRTPLMIAVERHHSVLIKPLAKYSAGEQLADGTTALMIAVQLLDAVSVKALAKAESGIATDKGKTALMLASEQGSLALCKLLAKNEAGLQMHDGTTALMIALERGYEEVVALLYRREKDICKDDGTTPHQLAAKTNRQDIMQIFTSKKDNTLIISKRVKESVTELKEHRS
ncbi:Kinase, NEK [Giardia duodenalis]|uniref:non-specific serine/threonine protein kinase n=1 Tax=Giardia intestinalis (strain ATCC 50803 / WB clone C6) TaxID=184922 RepID=A8BNP0_GIAIC|nr:Kinase, NEK [Giardia intestinalis]KAE8302489.1 Kinase, NEK [Giardia intestinalis]|eukprot:XP_001705957.1 Kinase, NEK [Giardia lamblia ATCC 50803]